MTSSRSGPDRMPDVLIVGAQKSGTTTLFETLSRHPDVCFGPDKEPGILLHQRGHRALYESHFRNCTDSDILIDGSTAYSMATVHPGVPTRAVNVLAPGFVIVYIVRDPLSRLMSHHYHELKHGMVDHDLGVAIEQMPSLVDNGKYGMQLAAWLDHVPKEQVLVLCLEALARDPHGEIARLASHLRLDGLAIPRASSNDASRRVARGAWKGIIGSGLYRQTVRRVVPRSMRSAVAQRLLPSIPVQPKAPSLELQGRLRDAYSSDLEDFRQMLTLDEASRVPWLTHNQS